MKKTEQRLKKKWSQGRETLRNNIKGEGGGSVFVLGFSQETNTKQK